MYVDLISNINKMNRRNNFRIATSNWILYFVFVSQDKVCIKKIILLQKNGGTNFAGTDCIIIKFNQICITQFHLNNKI